VLALVLSPFGLEGPGLWLMGAGLRWILWVAETVSGWENARGFVVAPDPAVLPLIALGAVFFVLWRGAGRFIGLVGVVFGFWLWSQSVRPAVLIAESGGLVGWMTPEGRALSRERTAGFVARTWLENDGDGAVQEVAARRVVPEEKASAVVHLSGKRAVAAFDGCAGPAVVVASVPVEGILPGGCRVLDPPRLRRTGAIALYRAAGGWREVTARGHVGERLWTRWPDQ
jgi:competence protein ComEC